MNECFHYIYFMIFRRYLSDLIDTFHVFLKMLERFCSNKGSIIIKVYTFNGLYFLSFIIIY